MLPNKTVISVTIAKNSLSDVVYDQVVEKIALSKDLASNFALFEIVEQGFDRKLSSNEYPYNLYIQNIQNTSVASTCLVVKKWVFEVDREVELCSHDLLETFFYYQVGVLCLLPPHSLIIDYPLGHRGREHRTNQSRQ